MNGNVLPLHEHDRKDDVNVHLYICPVLDKVLDQRNTFFFNDKNYSLVMFDNELYSLHGKGLVKLCYEVWTYTLSY